MSQTRIEKIRQRLTDALHPSVLEIEDQSHLHAGHAGAREHGGGHFALRIESPAFEGKNTLQRHRMVYDALSDMMQTEIHALSIQS